MNRPDYTSLVPHYTFAETLAEQEAQLAENPASSADDRVSKNEGR